MCDAALASSISCSIVSVTVAGRRGEIRGGGSDEAEGPE